MHELFGRTPGAVLFDLDGTLYAQAPVRRAMAVRIVAGHASRPVGLARSLRTLSAYRRAQEDLRAIGYDGGIAAEQAERAARRSGVEPAEVHVLVERWMERAPLDLIGRHRRADVVALIDELTERGVPLGLVSDYPADAKLAALGLTDRFAVVVSAQDSDVGVFKPHPRGLLVALERLGVEPDLAFYVGDRLDVDLPAARAAGVSFVSVGARRGEPLRLVDQPSRSALGSTTTRPERLS